MTEAVIKEADDLFEAKEFKKEFEAWYTKLTTFQTTTKLQTTKH